MSQETQAAARFTLDDFNYELPDSLIAQAPTPERTGSRLLHVDAQGNLQDRQFCDIAQLFRPGDLLVFNSTRVIKARLYGEKPTGGRIEALIERVQSTHEALAHIRASKAPKPATELMFKGTSKDANAQDDPIPDLQYQAQVVSRHDDLYLLRFEQPVLHVLEAIGHVPLPPYIAKEDTSVDLERYQTVYARHPGAVAAPTAGLHFDEPLLETLSDLGVSQAWVTLHIGAGTFAPVRHNDLSQHQMHAEHYTIDAPCIKAIHETRARGGRVIAVGTTSVRALESNAVTHGSELAADCADTRLFITPGFEWKVVDAMVTNFHLPKSTLLMLVASFCNFQTMRQAYAHAVKNQYRFFSYGDAMFIEAPSARCTLPQGQTRSGDNSQGSAQTS